MLGDAGDEAGDPVDAAHDGRLDSAVALARTPTQMTASTSAYSAIVCPRLRAFPAGAA